MTMSTAFMFHPVCTRHDMGAGHPEQPERLTAIRDAVQIALPGLTDTRPKAASYEALVRAHSARHVDAIFAASPSAGRVRIDPDTAMNEFSLDAARYAAGAVIDAVDLVGEGRAKNAFCCIRPPGHHAEYDRPMGFCLFNNVAVGALHALYRLGMERIAILDFDVHQGNGTEDIFRDDARVLFCSTFQHPFYPHTNSPSVAEQIVNVPLPPGTAGPAFRRAVEAAWLPAVRRFRPQLLLVSAGFDGHRDDPLADLDLVDEDYDWLATTLLGLASELCDGRLVAALEGGYDLAALGRSAALFITRMQEA